ncbi:uncharacterized protein F4822DRAFT_217778 [Hypoxylon trugodes]|uniref:uncharacterized protein n=1 Tax=Hypoxylon trugodes TaxID=326681 RepID=UPI00219316AC|nr:uncharacterized protein F4822DRAFT_217778 [Hypoxylon trugodes]KAI1389901.1 hypothetical protein F4822DRAFT_217778 [Hypoxylon trugodes]
MSSFSILRATASFLAYPILRSRLPATSNTGLPRDEESQVGSHVPKQIEDYPRGYPRMAALQSSDPTFTMFRRFALLHVRTLLLAQDEICYLEEQLHDIDEKERTQLYLSSRVYDENSERQTVIREIKTKLREYDDDLDRFFKQYAYHEPTPRSLQSFRGWMNFTKPLIEPEAKFIQSTDFVSPPHKVEEGYLEELVEILARKSGIDDGLLKTERERRQSSDPDLHFYSIRRRRVVARIILTTVACSTLLIPTAVLFIVPNRGARLGVISIFTVLFGSIVALITQARRHDIFAATSAFAAVMVVFVSNIP